MNLKDTVEVSAVCRKCKKKFSTSVQFYYDTIPAGENITNFAAIICPFCGAKSTSSIPFLYFNRAEHTIYTVFSSSKFNSFERINLLANELFERHLSNLSFKEQAEIRKAKRKYVERELFLKAIGIDDRKNFILGTRRIRFTPPPSLSFKSENCFLGDLKNYKLSKNDIAFTSNGISDFQKDIIDEACKRLNSNGFTVNLVDIEEERQPSVTCGLLSIVLTVGSAVLIPILVNVISDIINDLRHKNVESEKTLKKNDDIKIIICEDGTKKVYFFEGNPDDVARVMKEYGQASLETLSLKNCHVANAADNVVADLMFPSTSNHQTFNEIAKEYQKVFHPNSAIEINCTQINPEGSEETICYKASLLIREGDFKAAYWMLYPLIDTAKNIEFFYDLALCLSHLEMVDRETLHATYEYVIKKYLACADLLDLEKFDGSFKQSELDKVTQEMVDEGVFVKDEEGVISAPPPKTDEEIQQAIDVHDSFWNFIIKSQQYDINELKQEAHINFTEAQLMEELDSIDSSLQRLMSDIMDNATSEMDRTSEQFDFLFRKKVIVKKKIEKIREERLELHRKHFKGLF